jgi:hypothetical protein
LLQDFEERRADYYEDTKTPLDAKAFTATLREELTRHLKALDMGMPTNSKVKIVRNKNPRSPPPAVLQASKHHLLQRRWQTNRQPQGRLKTGRKLSREDGNLAPCLCLRLFDRYSVFKERFSLKMQGKCSGFNLVRNKK